MAETINTQTTGYECVGIEKIEQTYEGLFDNKPNIITIYLTNGDTHQFKVMNGSQGVGIDRIEQRQTSSVSGGRNEFAIILTNGKEYTFSTYNGSGGSGSSGSFNQVLQKLNNMLMPSGKSYLYYNGSGFEWKSPDGSTGGGTADLSEYSWWGRKFDPASKMITGEMSAVTSIEFQSTKTNIRKKLYLDENGDLCFNGNLYATGGITALGSGGGTSGGGSGGGIRIKRNGSTLKDSNGDVLSCTSINFKYGENWNSTPILINSDNEVSVDLSVVANNGNGGSSSTLYPFTIYNGSSDNDYITYDGSSAAYLKFKSGFSISKVGLGYEISASGSGGTGTPLSSVMSAMNSQLGKTSYGTPQFLYWNGSTYTWKNESEISGGSGSSSRIKKIKLFTNNSDSSFETVELGSADTIGFMAGDNVSLQAVVKEYTNVIKISANVSSSGGSSGSVDLSNYLTKTEASSTYAVKNHTHSAVAITDFEDAARLVKVNNAKLADKANELNSAVTLWGNTFYGSNNIGTASSRADLKYVKDIYAGDTFDIKAGNNNNSLLKVDGTPSIYVGFGYMANAKASLLLFGNKTTIYTRGDDYQYNFNGGVFDVNTNAIHFGHNAGGGKISWDAANNAFKIEGNVYATGGITALGVSNSATTSNNVDFTFKSVTANTFNVKDSIQISDKLVLNRDHDDVYLASSSIGTYYMYLDGNDKNYYLTSNGDAHFNNLSCDYLDIPGAESFKIVDANSTTFTIQFQYNGKTYEFTPSDSEVSVS